MQILRAALEAVDAGVLVRRSLATAELRAALAGAERIDVLAAGKAAVPMLTAALDLVRAEVRHRIAIGPAGARRPAGLAPGVEWFGAGHPAPTPESVAAGRRAIDLARATAPGDRLLVLLSGGGSALMALPAEGVTLAEKQETARGLMEAGADIHELNTVRKHLSAIKGGQLAAAARAPVWTLALSDVVGDDLSVIASGPTVPDATTFAAALGVIDRRGGRAAYPRAVIARLMAGAAGDLPDTPAPGDSRLARSVARVIGPQRGAIDGARTAAAALGYHVEVVADAVTGEARDAARRHVAYVRAAAARLPRPLCVIAAGETTVSVRGRGRGGRNQEFACAMAEPLMALGHAVAASIGTDGIDGPTDAAGAIVDTTTVERARARGLGAPAAYLAGNDTYAFFDPLGDLVRTGPTGTNVGDLQVVLIA